MKERLAAYAAFLAEHAPEGWNQDESLSRFVQAGNAGFGVGQSSPVYKASAMFTNHQGGVGAVNERHYIRRPDALTLVLSLLSRKVLYDARFASLRMVDEHNWQYNNARDAVSYARMAHGIHRRRKRSSPLSAVIQQIIDDWQNPSVDPDAVATLKPPFEIPPPKTPSGSGTLTGVTVGPECWVFVDDTKLIVGRDDACRAAALLHRGVTQVTFGVVATNFQPARLATA